MALLCLALAPCSASAQYRFEVWTTENGLPQNSVYDITQTRDGYLWFTTLDGLARYDGVRFTVFNKNNSKGFDSNRLRRPFITTYSTQNGLYDDNVYPIYQDRAGAIWIGAGGSLSRAASGKIVNYTEKDVLGHRFHVQSLCEDRQGRIWVGSYSELGWFKDDKYTGARDIVPSGAVYAIYEDRGGNLWFGGQYGLVKYKDGAREVYTTARGLPGDDVKVIYEDRHGNLWIGTYGGLARLADGKFTSFTERDGLASDRVRSIYEDADGTFWIGTYDGGLSRLKDGKFTTYNVRNGLYNDGVFQILEDARGVFWMSCNRGIYRVSRRQLDDYADGKISSIICAAYGKQDGMLNSECNGGRQPGGIKARDGKLWFPTQGGVVVIDPEAAPQPLATTCGMLEELFPTVKIYTAPVPAYLGGLMCFICAGGAGVDFTLPRQVHARAGVLRDLRYYTSSIHTAAFQLPPYIESIIGIPQAEAL